MILLLVACCLVGVKMFVSRYSKLYGINRPALPLNLNKHIRTNYISNVTSSNLVKVSKTFHEKSTLADPQLVLQKQLAVALKEAQKQVYYVLIWELPFGEKNIPQHVSFPELCGLCEATYDRDMIIHPNTKAVIFHFRETHYETMPIENRRPDQFYVWWTMESPATVLFKFNNNLKRFRNVFNLTMSYRRDSDIFTPYRLGVEQILNKKFAAKVKEIDAIVEEKQHLALWLVSNCAWTSGAKKRWSLVEKLEKAGLNLHKRGNCFPDEEKIENKEVIRKYKFYLAFENSYHCKDYITEKLTVNSLQMGTVPIVWGALKSEYEAFTPSNSFIYAEDFKTSKELVEYLNYLDKNDTAYKEYFWWRTKTLESLPNQDRSLASCQLCRIIHGINVDNLLYNPRYKELKSTIPMIGHSKEPQVVKSLHDWFYGNETSECLEDN